MKGDGKAPMFSVNFKKHTYLYYAAVGLIIAAVYIIQTSTGLLPKIYSVNPMPILPLICCISAFDGEITGAIVGATVGVILDITSLTTDGYNAIVLLIMCVVSGLFSTYLLNNRLPSVLLLSAGFTSVYYFTYWVFRIAIHGYENAGYYLLRFSLPEIIYTWIFTIPFYFIIRKMSRPPVKKPAKVGMKME